MKFWQVLGVVLACGLAVPAWSAQGGDCSYRGDSADEFERFTRDCLNKNYPKPKVLDYFDPKVGGTEKAIRYAHWKPAGDTPAGVVVHFNGRTEFIERNIFVYEELLKKGYEVWSFDWRGQGLSARELSGDEIDKHTIGSFDSYLADASAFIDRIARVKEASGTKILLAHSMGGQIALRYLLDPNISSPFDKVVLNSPLLKVPGDCGIVRIGNDLKRVLLMGENRCVIFGESVWENDFCPLDENGDCPDAGSRAYQDLLPQLAEKTCAAVRTGNWQGVRLRDVATAAKYTSDFEKLAIINCFVAASRRHWPQERNLGLACPTSNWLNAAFASTDKVIEHQASLPKEKILMIRSDVDQAVDPGAQKTFCEDAGIACHRVEDEVPYSGHEILIERDAALQAFLRRFFAFVKKEQQADTAVPSSP